MIKIRKLGKMSEKNNRISFHEMEEYGMILQTFMEGYRYVRRVIERSGQSAYLLLCTMTDGKGVPLEKGERLGKVAEELEQAIRNSLRRGDMFTRYSDNQFLIDRKSVV